MPRRVVALKKKRYEAVLCRCDTLYCSSSERRDGQVVTTASVYGNEINNFGYYQEVIFYGLNLAAIDLTVLKLFGFNKNMNLLLVAAIILAII